ncbi:MAG: glucose-1-phosphate thymidylyltransferase RfbA [Paracoccaceae bacterium]
MKGIILAGGNGTRLYPSTVAVSKQLLPVYDKPMIFYPLSTLMLANIRDILIITNAEHTEQFHKLLGDGSQFGLSLNYAIQSSPNGIPDALLVGKHFLGSSDVVLMLGDNILFGSGLPSILQNSISKNVGATIFTYPVKETEKFGVLTLDARGKAVCVDEKPQNSRSNLAITGIYIFQNDVIKMTQKLEVSERGETEITDIIRNYMDQKRLNHYSLGRGFSWFDTGTPSSLLSASHFIQTIERRQGFKIGCLEEIAMSNGWLSAEDLINKISNSPSNCYNKYLNKLVSN